MSHTRPRNHPRLIPAVLASSLAIGGLLASATAARAVTEPTPINSVVLHMTGAMTLKLDPSFVKKVKAAKATISTRGGGATYKGKTRTALLPIDSATTVQLDPLNTDIASKGTLLIRKKNGRKISAQDIAIRIRPAAFDIGSTLRGTHGKEFAALTLSTDTRIEQSAGGYSFVKVPMLVSLDLAAAAKKARIKGLTAGAPLGVMNTEVAAALPSFALPDITSIFTGGLPSPF